MTTAKEKALDWIQSLPADCTLADIHYHLYVREKVEEGLQALERGEVVTHEEVKRRLAGWLSSSGQPQR